MAAPHQPGAGAAGATGSDDGHTGCAGLSAGLQGLHHQGLKEAGK